MRALDEQLITKAALCHARWMIKCVGMAVTENEPGQTWMRRASSTSSAFRASLVEAALFLLISQVRDQGLLKSIDST